MGWAGSSGGGILLLAPGSADQVGMVLAEHAVFPNGESRYVVRYHRQDKTYDNAANQHRQVHVHGLYEHVVPALFQAENS